MAARGDRGRAGQYRDRGAPPGRRRLRGCTAALCAALAAAATAPAARAQPGALDAEEIELRVLIGERKAELEHTLETWVGQNTGSFHFAGLQAFAELLAGELRALDFEVTVEPAAPLNIPGTGEIQAGPLVSARRAARPARADSPRLLLVGHYDTVFEPDSPFQRLSRDPEDPQRATGPGATDMKGGLLVMLSALRALRDSGDLDRADVTVLFNGDEELGSLASRARIEEEARRADYGLVFESAQSNGAMVRSRRGLGQFHLTVHGVAAHAGSAHEQGRSAIHELATKILAIEALTDYERGITLNVGTVQGGTKRNIVPDRAEAWVDLRYTNAQDGEQVRAAIDRIADEHTVPDTRTELWGSLHRPPKPAEPSVDTLLDVHAQVCKALGIEVPEAVSSGGGTDGSLMSAVGLPTLDSLGVVGGKAHTEEEFVQLDSLSERAAVAAAFVHRLIQGDAAELLRSRRNPPGKSGLRPSTPAPRAPSQGGAGAEPSGPLDAPADGQ